MKKLGCAQCGKMVKAQKGTAVKSKKTKDPFAPQTVSITKNGKVIYQEKPPKGDKGDNSDKYKYPLKKQQKGGSPRLETKIPTGVTGPNMTPRVMQKCGFFSPEARAARKDKRTERKITKQIKKSVMGSGKIIKAKRGGIKK